jgi:hypothetical protein
MLNPMAAAMMMGQMGGMPGTYTVAADVAATAAAEGAAGRVAAVRFAPYLVEPFRV